MDSLGRLADNLPRQSSNALNAAEHELQSAFRGSALAITTLLRAAQSTTKKSFEAGYSAALQDVLEFVQQGLDIDPPEDSSHPHGTLDNHQRQGVAQVIDYIEARREAVRLAAADNDGDDDSEALQHLKAAQPVSLYQQQRPSSAGPMHQATTVPAQQRHLHLTSDIPACCRQSSRSVSPIAVRSRSSAAPATSASTSTHVHAATHSILQPSADDYHTSIDITTSSSVPASPGLRTVDSPFELQFAVPTQSHMATSQAVTTPQSDSSNTTASLGNIATAQSPITRLQAKRGKDRDRRGHRPHFRESKSKDAEGDHERDGSTVGMKRRWTAAMAPSAVDIDTTADSAQISSAPDTAGALDGDAATEVEVSMRNATDADMEDGLPRPAKRTNRR